MRTATAATITPTKRSEGCPDLTRGILVRTITSITNAWIAMVQALTAPPTINWRSILVPPVMAVIGRLLRDPPVCVTILHHGCARPGARSRRPSTGRHQAGRENNSELHTTPSVVQRESVGGNTSDRVEIAPSLHALEIAGDQFVSYVASIACIGYHDTLRQGERTSLRHPDRSAHARDDHSPAIRTAGDKLAIVQAHLTVMQVAPVCVGQSVIEKHRQSDGLVHGGA